MQRQLAAKGLFQIALVTGRQCIRLCAMYHHYRRVLATSMGITKFHSAPVDHWRWVTRHGIFEDTCQTRRCQRACRRVMSRVDRVIELTDTRAMQRRDKVNVSVINEL